MIEKILNVGLDYGIEMLRSNINSDAEASEDNVKPPICGLFVDCGESAALLPRRCLVLHPLLSQVAGFLVVESVSADTSGNACGIDTSWEEKSTI